MDAEGHELVLLPGQELRFPRPMLSFLAEGHPRRTTELGPLIPRNSAVTYVGPYPKRPGVHVAEAVTATGTYEVPFRLADLGRLG